MESSQPSPDEARLALEGAADAQHRLMEPVALAPGFVVSLGVAAAVQIGTAANEVMHDSWPARAAAVLGFAALLAVGWWQAARLRRDQGVAISGLMDSVVLGVDHAASFVYAAAFAIALVAAAGDRWVLVVGASVLGGVGYALAGRRWFERYRADPAASAQGLSPALTSVVAAVAVIGFVVLAALAR